MLLTFRDDYFGSFLTWNKQFLKVLSAAVALPSTALATCQLLLSLLLLQASQLVELVLAQWGGGRGLKEGSMGGAFLNSNSVSVEHIRR